MNESYVKIWIPKRNFTHLTYKNETGTVLREGMRVLVPLRNEQVIGYMVGIEQKENITFPRIKNIIEIVDKEPVFPESLLQLTQWASAYYLRPRGEFMHAALPSGLHISHNLKASITRHGTLKTLSLDVLQKQEQQILEFIAQRKSVAYSALRKEFKYAPLFKILNYLNEQHFIVIKQELKEHASGSRFKNAVELVQYPSEADALTEKQRSVLEFLKNREGNVLMEDVVSELKVTTSVIKRLHEKGYLRIYQEMIPRELLWPDMLSSSEKIILTEDQSNALALLMNLFKQNTFSIALLHGVTGSGKTELYIRMIEHALQQGKTALLLMPEIALLPAMQNRFKTAFGTNIGILHSGLTNAERAEQWLKIKNKELRVVIGVRSAIFAPLTNIGIIIVDEEHDDSYKQTESPRYQARDLAIMRARLENCLGILGSATPSLESFHWAQKQKYAYIHLPKRIHDATLPEIQIIDMREEYKKTGNSYFSEPLLTELQSCLEKKQQAMILLNRRGYANYLLCRECGQVIECPRCSISLHYHHQYHALVCHYCGLQETAPEQCPNCHSEFISYIGSGTERVEALLKEIFPDAAISRLDSDTARNHKKLLQILSDFSYHRIDFLVGTSIIGKGHHFPKVTLVGVISADSALSLPDFRSAEKTFQLVTQVAGRAGRGKLPGRVLVQSFLPEHYAIQASQFHSYKEFYEQEIRFRANLEYPPFLSLANIVISSSNKTKTAEAAKYVTQILRPYWDKSLKALGPSPCPIFKIANQFRYHILIKLLIREEAKAILNTTLSAFESQYPYVSYYCDIDPISIL
jgi:primosomal protein N' (replication factor Y) (superfamily II helicase)